MKGDFPDAESLYQDAESRDLLANAARVEAQGYCRWTRIREVLEFCLLMDYRRIGLAHGPVMAREAAEAAEYFRKGGLDPILPPASIHSDPLGQAQYFQEQDTRINVIAGLAVAAEALFTGASSALCTCLFSRDLRLYHNPVAALYLSRSYLQKPLHGHWPRDERLGRVGGSEELLAIHASGDPATNPPRSRLEELMDVAHRMGYNHLGITFCVGLREEVKILSKVLETNGFRVSSASCKMGAVPKEEMGITNEEKVRPGQAEMICNPVAQARLLNREEVQMTMILGQCMGHDSSTFRALDAPAVSLVTKDRALAHNPVAALHLKD